LQRALLSRLLSQLAQVYASVRIAFIMELVAPLRDAPAAAAEGADPSAEKEKGAFDPEQVESYIMGCARRGELSVRVDHADGSIAFVDDPFVDALDEAPVPSASSSNAKDTATSASAFGAPKEHEAAVQPSVAELVRTRLGSVARCLHHSLEVIAPAEEEQDEEAQKARFTALAAEVQKERKALQLRRALVARRRELLSELSVRKEKEEAIRRADATRREKEDEAKRAKEDARKRELERIHKIQVDMKLQDAERYKAALVEKGILKPGDHQVYPSSLSSRMTSSLTCPAEHRRARHGGPHWDAGRTVGEGKEGAQRAAAHRRQACRPHRARVPQGGAPAPRAGL
jgi:translation initiation factor 3 subunit A